MSCPCGLTKAVVLKVAEKHGVPLVGGKCQNPLADGSDGVCGKALGAHPLAQGNIHFLVSLDEFVLLLYFDEIFTYFPFSLGKLHGDFSW